MLDIYVGYTRQGVSCIDVNECLNSTSNTCSHVCSNNDGSYSCSCPVGYVLNSDLRTCDGQHYVTVVLLYFIVVYPCEVHINEITYVYAFQIIYDMHN